MESVPKSIINIEEEDVIIQQVVQSLQSLVDASLVQQKEVYACLESAISLSSF